MTLSEQKGNFGSFWFILDMNNNRIRSMFKVVNIMFFSLCIRLCLFRLHI